MQTNQMLNRLSNKTIPSFSYQENKVKLSNQDLKIINYCSGKTQVAWEELAQFAKDPTTVKLKTLQKVISDLKKKYRDAGLESPITCSLISLVNSSSYISAETIVKTEPQEQKVVQLRITAGGNRVPADNKDLDAHIDFKLEPYFKRVRTKNGVINLGDRDWELFKLLHENAEKMLSIENIRDVIYKGFGSKLPYNWASAISGTLTSLRKNIKELKTQNRLITIIGGSSTFYMLK